MKKFTLAALVATVAVITTVSPASANEVLGEQAQKQTLTQEVEHTCEGGAYGKCYLKVKNTGEQEQRQRLLASKIIYKNGKKVHVPADTAINTTTVAIIMAAAFLGLGASVALTKIV